MEMEETCQLSHVVSIHFNFDIRQIPIVWIRSIVCHPSFLLS